MPSYLPISGRRDGLDRIVLRRDDGSETAIPFAEAAFTASLGSNLEPDAPLLRLNYSSMVTPATVFDYDVASGALVTRKVQEVPSGYDASQYATERVTITARDGVPVPVSIVYPKDFPRDGRGKLHLYGYGAYGYAMPPSFSANRLSLLDRGFAYAIAHIRGGDDLGYQWYLDGKLEQAHQHVQRFRRCGEGPDRRRLGSAGQYLGQRRFGRRRTDGRGRQFRSRPVARRGRACAVCRCAQHDARRQPAADAGRMARMGQPDHRQGGVRADPQLHPL